MSGVGGDMRILLIEDDAEDADLVCRLFARVAVPRSAVTWCADPTAARRALADGRFDVVLLDYELGPLTGLDLLAELGPATMPPVVLLTGHAEDATLDTRALEAGAVDFVEKGRLDAALLARVVRYAIGRRHAEDQRLEALQRAQAAVDELRFRAFLLDTVEQGVVATDAAGRVTFWNQCAARLFGWTAEEARGRDAAALLMRGLPAAMPGGRDGDGPRQVRRALRRTASWSGELMLRRRDGSTFPAFVSITTLRDADGRASGFVGVCTDVSARRLLEEQFRQAQKMDVVGQLAGGVAHDFNNLLTVIRGTVDLLQPQFDGTPAAADLEEIRRAATRAGELTRRLLAFSRKQLLQPRDVAVQSLVDGIVPMLRRLLGEDIVLTRVDGGAGPTHVRVDPGELEQVLVNLAVNARDAMPRGGTITIRVDAAAPAPDVVPPIPDAAERAWVHLAVEDTGEGMPPSVRARVFEPFFTTKGPGRGTGLGLAMVYGVAQRAGGGVAVESTQGVGTRLHVWLPRVEAPPVARATPAVDVSAIAQERPTAPPTVCVVEDEPGVRRLAQRFLERAGFRVVVADRGETALALLEDARPSVDLVISDVVMPGMGGLALAAHLAARWPTMPVLLTTGYTDDELVRRTGVPVTTYLLQKPYTAETLIAAVRGALEARARGESIAVVPPPDGAGMPSAPAPVLRWTIDDADRVQSVSPDWRSHAEASGATGLAERVIGAPIWQFLSDETTRSAYRGLFRRVRETGETVSLGMRCDGPDMERYVEVEVSPQGGGHLALASRTLYERRRPTVRLLDPSAPRSAETLCVCSWCKRVQVDRWLEATEAERALALPIEGPLPQVTHGVCPTCADRLMGDASVPAIAATGAAPRGATSGAGRS